MYNDFHCGDNPLVLAAIHFEMKHSSIENILKPAEMHFDQMKKESGMTIHPSLYDGDLIKNVLNPEKWLRGNMSSLSNNESLLLECIARCIGKQIIFQRFIGNQIIPMPFPYGAHLPTFTRINVIAFHAGNNGFFISASKPQ